MPVHNKQERAHRWLFRRRMRVRSNGLDTKSVRSVVVVAVVAETGK